jgi:hypothetical protein
MCACSTAIASEIVITGSSTAESEQVAAGQRRVTAMVPHPGPLDLLASEGVGPHDGLAGEQVTGAERLLDGLAGDHGGADVARIVPEFLAGGGAEGPHAAGFVRECVAIGATRLDQHIVFDRIA